MRLRKGPTTVGHPGALLEVDIVERTALALPVIGGAAEIAQPRAGKVGLAAGHERPESVAAVKALDLFIELEAAALEHDDR